MSAMASKCWFVLKQTHYPPPLLPRNGTGKVSGGGPITLGHLIPDLNHLDNIINRRGPLEIPPDMPIYSTKQLDLRLEGRISRGVELDAGADVPIASAVGLTLQLGAGVAFQRTVQNYWDFESLDTFIIQPTSEYIEDSVSDDEIVSYLQKRHSLRPPTLFMITGLKIAHGTRLSSTEESRRGVHGGPGLELPAIAGVNGYLGISKDNGLTSAVESASDFIWAVRLAKISKGVLSRDWSHSTFSSGATFSLDDGAQAEEPAAKVLQDQGFEAAAVIQVNGDDEVFVLSKE